VIDIFLYAPNGMSDLTTFIDNHPAANPIRQDDGFGGKEIRPGIQWCLWAGTGSFSIAGGGVAPGILAMMRVLPVFFDDVVTPDPESPDALEQWARSRVAQYIKNNGTQGTMLGGDIPYYELDGVRMLRPIDVELYIQSNNLIRHEWVTGNSY
jgi:hypothetical protein